MTRIIRGSKYGDPRAQATGRSRYASNEFQLDDTVHGFTLEEADKIHEKFAREGAGVVKLGKPNSRFAALEKALDREAGAPSSVDMVQQSGGGAFFHSGRPYNPEFEDPSRQMFPVHRVLFNRYARMFYKLDPTIQTGINLLSTLPFGKFDLTGEDVDGEVLDVMEDCREATRVESKLCDIAREFMITGEAIPHNFWDNDRSIWGHIAIHNPDQVEVVWSPFLPIPPVLEFIPDERLRAVVTSQHPMIAKLREGMPPDLLAALQQKKNIPLHPLNVTFIPRKLHDYEVRGTSLISTMWRILMFEDALFNANIQIARRAAAPLKVVKLGNQATGYIPPPAEAQKVQQLLVQAESDPNAWLAYHFGINFELVGVQERLWKISTDYDLIEKIKLTALGISQGLLHGEVTYASSAAGLTVFLQQLKNVREFFTKSWLIPKFFKPLAEMNKWVKPTPAELSHGVRTKRSKGERELRYIIPKIEWAKSLDPSVDSERINAMQTLTQLGVKFSRTTMMAAAGLKFEEELNQIVSEQQIEQEIIAAHPEAAQALTAPPPGADGGGGGAGMFSPGMDTGFGPPAEDTGAPAGAPPMPGEVPGAPIPGDTGVAPGGAAKDKGENDDSPAEPEDRFYRGNWRKGELDAIVRAFRSFDVADLDDAPWSTMVDASPAVRQALAMEDASALWDAVEEWLASADYPTRTVTDLQDILVAKNVLKAARAAGHPEGPAPKRESVVAAVARKLNGTMGQATGTSGDLAPVNFLTGVGQSDPTN